MTAFPDVDRHVMLSFHQVLGLSENPNALIRVSREKNGFRKERSTEGSIMGVTSIFYQILNEGREKRCSLLSICLKIIIIRLSRESLLEISDIKIKL